MANNSNPFSNSSPMYGAVGYQNLTVGAAAVALTVPENATGCAISVESSDPALSLCCRYKFGIAPGASDGNPLYNGTYMELPTLSAINDIKFISADGANHTIRVQYYH